ncbi:DUF3619 family protein [Limnohabitans sp.]|uniref:DUF3619 family protein n=1 Tax=Limnohabitans sp. TaxID=1907725 RepID=UPI00333E2E77
MKNPITHTADMDLWGHTFTKQLDLATQNMGHDICERLRIARVRALESRPAPIRLMRYRTALQANGSLTGHGEGLNLWRILASALPLVALVMGLILVQAIQQELTESDIASIDSALLLDDLPPDAYTDPGFLQFLKVQLVQPTRND